MSLADAPCKGMPLAIFFPELSEETPLSESIATARGFCDECPIAFKCLKLALDSEGNEGADYRFGIYAGFTPQQRHSLMKRGQALACDECGSDYTPNDLRSGMPRCLCGQHERVKPIPDRGDLWAERHTKLARIVIGWFIKNLDEAIEVPDALALSRTIKVPVKDMRRVYQALREDHVIKDGRIRLLSASVDHWLPKHLRPVMEPATVTVPQ